MGYDVHITRADEWFDSEESPISIDEWLAYVQRDGSMRLDGQASVRLGSGVALKYEGTGLAVWTGFSGHDELGNKAWFDHRAGRIVVKNPTEEILAKMMKIARALDARVQGDDGEIYAPRRKVKRAKKGATAAKKSATAAKGKNRGVGSVGPRKRSTAKPRSR